MFPNLPAWLQALTNGQVTAAPAEGVYGYTADPTNLQAIQSLLKIKHRSPSKGFILLIPNPSHLSSLCPPLSLQAQQAVQTYWQPGQPATTLRLPPLPHIPASIVGDYPTILVRCPQVDYMQTYLNAWGKPLISTSLNLSGQPPATRASQIPTGITALTLPHALSGQPSRIFNPQTSEWVR